MGHDDDVKKLNRDQLKINQLFAGRGLHERRGRKNESVLK
jgi:hypothetical protein